MDSHLIFATHLFYKELSRLTIPSPINLIWLGFPITNIGDLMRDIMEPCRDSTSLKPQKSMERNKYSFGEEVMISLHPSLLLMTKDTQDFHQFTKTSHLTLYQRLSHLRPLLIEFSLSGTIPFAHQFWTTRMLSLLPMETPLEP